MKGGFWSRWLAGLTKQEDGKLWALLGKSTPSSPPSMPIEVDFNQNEINDLRTSVQSEFSQYLGQEIELEDATDHDGDDVAFRILGAIYLSDVDDQKYREIFWKHQRRIVEAQNPRRDHRGDWGFLGSFPLL